MTKRSFSPHKHRPNQAIVRMLFAKARQHFSRAFAQQDYPQALDAVLQATRLNPGNMALLGDLALCQLRCGHTEMAYETYLRIVSLPPEVQEQCGRNWLDGLTETCGWMGNAEEVRKYGNLALTRADKLYATGKRWAIPKGKPPAFDSTQPERNIIAFSLFGALPRYCETAVMNAQTASRFYPGWTCRFWVDSSVPSHVIERLRKAGAQITDMTGSSLAKSIPPVMWRFLVMSDPDVSRFVIRDCDALLSERDGAAVAEWVNSDRWFHTMRDYFTHTELILAGMWGGCTGVLPAVTSLMSQYLATYQDSAHFVDQYFLRQIVWPTLRRSVLCHDELFDFHQARPFPAHPQLSWNTDKFHVGSNVSYKSFQGNVPPGERKVGIILQTAEEQELAYLCEVKECQWQLNVPFFLADAFDAGRLRIRSVSPSDMQRVDS